MFGKKKTSYELFEAQLDQVLFYWPVKGGKAEPVRIADLMRGIMVFGGTGSGKSSGSGNTISKALLKQGFGALVLCAKPDEGPRWKRYIQKIGREKDLVYFNEKSGLQFNPILYEYSRGGDGAGETLNLVELIMNIHLLGQNFMSGSGGGGSNEGFWENALRRCISRSIDLLKLAGEPVSIINMRKIMVSALDKESVKDYYRLINELKHGDEQAKLNANEKITAKRGKNYCLHCLIEANVNFKRKAVKNDREEAAFELALNYFFREFANLSERTRSTIEEFFYGLVEPFLSGILKDHFGQGISPELWPEMTFKENKIIILDFPVKDYLVAGIYAQGLYKYMWQQAMERRRPLDADVDGNQNPVFLWVDECQYFINPNYDTMFQTTARSSLVSTIYLTQSLHNIVFTMGSNSPEARAKGLLANMGTKIFHANSDFDTNQWAANMIGHDIAVLASLGAQLGPGQAGSLSEQILMQVQPHEFTTLKYGRKENNKKVEAYIIKTGPWAHTKKNYVLTEFEQD
ncbi:MAG: TraM recognition domain-containing protein [Saprospiraceae bacterium]